LSILRSVRDGRGFDATLALLALAYLLVFSAFPLVYNILMSFQEVDMFSLASLIRPFVGLANYATLFANPDFWPIMGNTAIFVAACIFFQLLFGFGLALFFQQDFFGASYLRGFFLAAWIIPALVAGAIWKWMFAGDTGVLNYLLSSTGMIHEKIFWLSNPAISLYSVIIANIWLGIPFNMILLSVGLAGIPKDMYEAAALDGAGAWKRFFFMTLPMMRSTLGAVVSLGIIFTLQQFDLFASLTQGGPANASNVAQYWSWQLSFQTYDIASGSAVSVLMLGFVIVVAFIYVRSTRHEHSA
jgi:multiple sugar transport system permease protein